MQKSIKLSTGPVPVAYTPWAVGEMFDQLQMDFSNMGDKMAKATYKTQCIMAYWGLAGGFVAKHKKEYPKSYFQAMADHLATQDDVNAVIEVLLEQFNIADEEQSPDPDSGGKQ